MNPMPVAQKLWHDKGINVSPRRFLRAKYSPEIVIIEQKEDLFSVLHVSVEIYVPLFLECNIPNLVKWDMFNCGPCDVINVLKREM